MELPSMRATLADRYGVRLAEETVPAEGSRAAAGVRQVGR